MVLIGEGLLGQCVIIVSAGLDYLTLTEAQYLTLTEAQYLALTE